MLTIWRQDHFDLFLCTDRMREADYSLLLNLLFSFLFFFSSNNQSRNFFRHFLQPIVLDINLDMVPNIWKIPYPYVVLWVTQITYFTVAVLVYFCLRNMKAEFVLKTVLGQDPNFLVWSKTFWTGQKTSKVLEKNCVIMARVASARNACFWTQRRQQHKKPLTVTSL